MSTETILEKDLMVDELDKDFNTTVFKTDAQRTKENTEKM